jgi:DNA-binding GntR family transcriptional regulator
VTDVDVEEAGRLYPLIWALERLAVEIAPELPSIAALEAANERLARALRDNDAVAASEADRAFHDALVEPAANPEITRVLADLKLRLRRIEIAYFGGTTTAEPSVAEHARIVTALAADDRAAAAAAIEENWRSPLARLRDTTPPARPPSMPEVRP